MQLKKKKKCCLFKSVHNFSEFGTEPIMNSMIQTFRVYCKSKGNRCCTPINLQVWIMQLVWIPSMCRAGCQVVCLLTQVCSCIHIPTVGERVTAAACGKAWLLCLKSVCARTPLPRPPLVVRERERWAWCPSPLSSSCHDGVIKVAPHGRPHCFELKQTSECLLLSSFNLNVFYRRLYAA